MVRGNKGRFEGAVVVGARSGMMTALRQTAKKARDGSTVWIILCDCGVERERSACEFRRSKSCGCLTKRNAGQYRAVDHTGKVVNDCRVIAPTEKRDIGGYVVWELECLLCGERFGRGAWSITKNMTQHRCAQWWVKYGHLVNRGRPPIPESGAHVNQLFTSYRGSARSRGLAFDITKADARKLFESDCHYCGARPSVSYTHSSLAGVYAWNGIDRMDSTVGYTVANCVACCSRCNFAKGNLSVDEFREWVHRAHSHMFAA